MIVFGLETSLVGNQWLSIFDKRRWREKSMAWKWSECAENYSGNSISIRGLRGSKSIKTKKKNKSISLNLFCLDEENTQANAK